MTTKHHQTIQISNAQLLSHQSGIREYQLIAEQALENGQTLDVIDIYNDITELIS